jgi:NAD(P)-dependent dehydrogenase (short-subunit alcohol dehydrogenase family)
MSALLTDKIAIVTGSGAGLGAAIAHGFASEGARVVVSDIDSDTAKKLRRLSTAPSRLRPTSPTRIK